MTRKENTKIRRHIAATWAVGQTFGRLFAVRCVGRVGGVYRYYCECSCGRSSIVRATLLKSGHTKSCGCISRDNTLQRNRESASHGLSRHNSGTYQSWQAMRNRCLNEKQPTWAAYGGVGIVPCAFLAESPRNLITILGERPPHNTLDRIKSSLGYFCGQCPECLSNARPCNVRWATMHEQTRNKSNNIWITHDGRTLILNDWARQIGVRPHTLHLRYYRGWSIERVLHP